MFYIPSNFQALSVQHKKFLKVFLLPVGDAELTKAFELMFFALDLMGKLYRLVEILDRALIVRRVPLFFSPKIKIVYLYGHGTYFCFIRKIDFLGYGQGAAERIRGFLHLPEIQVQESLLD
ncbi:MAG: hypothetical protein WBC70_15690 [Candidatus Aminicenantales bacterium]